MARPKKEHRPGGIYYIVLFGNGGQEVFSDDADMDRFVELLVRAQSKCNAQVLAFCTTKRDARVVIRVSDVPIGRLVQRVSTQYSRNTHAKYATSGYLFQHPYRSHLLDGTRDLLEIVRHVHLAPVESGDTDDTDTYRWSSHRAYLGLQEASWLVQGTVLDLLGAMIASPQHEYRQLMAGSREPAAPDGADAVPPHGFHPADDRFFRLASPAFDQTAGSSHNRPGHHCGCQKNERRSRPAPVGLARAAAHFDPRDHRLARDTEPDCHAHRGVAAARTRSVQRIHGLRALPGVAAQALSRFAGDDSEVSGDG